MISVLFKGKPFNITIMQVYALTSNAKQAEVEQFYDDLQDLLELTLKKVVLFNIGDWNVQEGIHEIPEVAGKFGLVVQSEAGQRPTEVCEENVLVIANTLFRQHMRRLYTQMVNEEIRLILFFATKNVHALYNQQKQDRELTVAQIMNSLLPNSDLN